MNEGPRAVPREPAVASFVVHDVSELPIVRFDPARLAPGCAAQWAAEMTALLDLDRPFVLIASGTVDEGREDRGVRARFLKAERVRLGRLCRAIIGIESNALVRAARNAQAAVLARAFGIEMTFVGTEEEATRIARARLDGASAPRR